jgi:hypothetical protein
MGWVGPIDATPIGLHPKDERPFLGARLVVHVASPQVDVNPVLPDEAGQVRGLVERRLRPISRRHMYRECCHETRRLYAFADELTIGIMPGGVGENP